ncbi:hypothetical protein LTR08_008577 [Meristemomyces frigidus]|nr:hypothetical protein LTR08_008577 [Meristemomyces frigidus]
MSKPYSWALVARKGNGEKIMNHDGVWMLESRHKFLSYIKKRQFKLMSLPSELRHEILKYLPEDTYIGVYLPGHRGMVPTGVELPVTARAGDKLLRQETIMITIEQTTFAIHSGPGNASFQNWLGDVDLRLTSKTYVTGFDAVKSLAFPYFSRFPHASLAPATPNSDIELMLSCRQVEQVSMVWVAQELVADDAATGQQGPKTVERLRKEYRLDRMLGLRKLRTLTLVRRGAGNSTALDDLAAWFRANMSGVDGQSIQVVLQ